LCALMSDGWMSAVANRAALARLYDWALTSRLFLRGPIPLSCSSAAGSALLAL
jgi:hypothetical protein